MPKIKQIIFNWFEPLIRKLFEESFQKSFKTEKSTIINIADESIKKVIRDSYIGTDVCVAHDPGYIVVCLRTKNRDIVDFTPVKRGATYHDYINMIKDIKKRYGIELAYTDHPHPQMREIFSMEVNK